MLEGGEEAELKTSTMRRPRIVISPGRLRGKERRSYWVAKRGNQVSRRPNDDKGGDYTVRKDSNSKNSKVNRVKPEMGVKIGLKTYKIKSWSYHWIYLRISSWNQTQPYRVNKLKISIVTMLSAKIKLNLINHLL